MNDWNNKIVVVTGGSDGLGREIALTFARQGAGVFILARDEEKLETVSSDAKSNGLEIDWLVCDVTSDQSVNRAVDEIIQRQRRIDVWVNNVGKSTRTSLTDCDVEHYKKLMEINFYSAVRCSLAVLKHLEETAGQLVNIGSLASKTGWPHMAPYSASKHALDAFAHQLRLEGPAKINYLHVCPGPIARPDSSTRYQEQAAQLSESSRQPGGGVKMKGIEPQKLAIKIERACRRRQQELIIPGLTRLLFALAALSPRLGDWILKRGKRK